MKEKKEFWELSFKYEELCRNISALDENHARRVIEDWIIQEMTKCHKLDSFFLQKAELNNDFIEKFRKQENLYRYKPYLIFMK